MLTTYLCATENFLASNGGSVLECGANYVASIELVRNSEILNQDVLFALAGLSNEINIVKNPTAVDDSGYTLLHWAAPGGHLETVKQLLNDNIDAKVRGDQTPLHMEVQEAVSQGSLRAVRLLFEFWSERQQMFGKRLNGCC
jgi:Ankyrin repeats (3 copies)